MGADRGLTATIFTNGMWGESSASSSRTKNALRWNFLFNVHEPGLRSEDEERGLLASLEIARRGRAEIGFNIYRPEFDLTFAADLIGSYSLKRRIRIGLASPLPQGENEYLEDPDLRRTGARLARQLKELERKDILGHFDCGFPLCMFNEIELGSLVHSTCSGFASTCGDVIDVDWDLMAWPCFPLGGLVKVPLSQFGCREEILEFFREKTAPFRRMGSRKRCLTCKYRYRDQCSGGCMARCLLNCEGESIGALSAFRYGRPQCPS